MKIIRVLILSMAALAAAGMSAQKSTLHPVSMAHMSTPNNGSTNMAHIEIEFSSPLEGAKVAKDSQNSSPDDAFPSTPTSIHAKAIAIDKLNRFARKVTVVHPDFDVCVINFDSIGFRENVKPGEHYKIKVDVPGALLVEANRAFYNLDFHMANAKYAQYVADPASKDVSLANRRMEVIKELQNPVKYWSENKNRTDKEGKFMTMKAMQMIYDKTHSSKAYDLYLQLRENLYGKSKRSSLADDGVTELTVDSVKLNALDNRPMSDNKLPHVDGAPYYSWVNVHLNLDDVVFTGGNQFTDAEVVDGVYRLYVPKGTDAIDAITIHQADCAPLVIPFSQFEIDEIKPASVYEVYVGVPDAALIEADRMFGNLNFHTAKNMYDDIITNESDYDEKTVTLARERLEDVTPLVDNATKERWDELRKIVDLRGGPIDRDELRMKCLETASLAEQMASKNVPGMEKKAEFYKDLAQRYKTAVFLTINAKQINKNKEPLMDKKGNFVPYTGKNIILDFEKVGLIKHEQVWLDAKGKGVFKAYLPERISRWLLNHPDESLKVTPKQYDYSGRSPKLVKIGDEFEIGLEDGDRSFSIQLFLQNKQN